MAEPAPKIFISWSGDHAQTVAGLVHEWLTKAYQRIDVFFSPDSIDKGDRSLKKIDAELEGCVAAIVVVTAESMKSAWVNYEVGALSALRLPDNRNRLVIPLLVGVERVTDVTGPLTQFQAVLLNITDFKRMIGSLNRVLSMEADWTERIVETTKKEIEAILTSGTIPVGKKAPERNDRDLLEEILVHVRGMRIASDVPYDLNEAYLQGLTSGQRELAMMIERVIDRSDYSLVKNTADRYVVLLKQGIPQSLVSQLRIVLGPGIDVIGDYRRTKAAPLTEAEITAMFTPDSTLEPGGALA